MITGKKKNLQKSILLGNYMFHRATIRRLKSGERGFHFTQTEAKKIQFIPFEIFFFYLEKCNRKNGTLGILTFNIFQLLELEVPVLQFHVKNQSYKRFCRPFLIIKYISTLPSMPIYNILFWFCILSTPRQKRNTNLFFLTFHSLGDFFAVVNTNDLSFLLHSHFINMRFSYSNFDRVFTS